MNRKQAAEFLGVSLRTLDRLGAEGRLRKGRALQKTRPIVVFDPAEVENLKAELTTASREERVFRRLNIPAKDSVGFRLDPYYLSRLTEMGTASNQSPGECARTLVIRALERVGPEEFTREVRRLREGLADTFYSFLTMKCGVSEKEAEEFVAETILKK